MSGDDWFRRTGWSEEDEIAFFSKLKRARKKCQYLRIQATYLTETHPLVALDLLDRYQSACSDEVDVAQAYVTRAEANLSLDRLDDALDAYRNALRREDEFPNYFTSAYIDFPFLIATKQISHCYDEALELLEKCSDRPAFPIEEFILHAAFSLIAYERRQEDTARHHADAALSAAQKEHSGFAYHAKLGLVGKEFNKLRKQLKRIKRGQNRFGWIFSSFRHR